MIKRLWLEIKVRWAEFGDWCEYYLVANKENQ